MVLENQLFQKWWKHKTKVRKISVKIHRENRFSRKLVAKKSSKIATNKNSSNCIKKIKQKFFRQSGDKTIQVFKEATFSDKVETKQFKFLEALRQSGDKTIQVFRSARK